MSRPRFLADHDLNEHIVAGVSRREPALEFIRLRDVGLSDRPDAEVLAFAAANGFLLVSHDVNTMPAAAYARVAAAEPMSGLLMVHQAQPIALVIVSLVLIWSASEAEDWHSHVRFLPL
jgi:predicted nuclease of predicted toxin-antitoxin system